MLYCSQTEITNPQKVSVTKPAFAGQVMLHCLIINVEVIKNSLPDTRTALCSKRYGNDRRNALRPNIFLKYHCESSVFSTLRIFSKICPALLNNPLKQRAFPLVCITGLATLSHLYVKLIFSHERKWGKEREG